METRLDQLTVQGELYDHHDDARVACFACGHECVIPVGERGVCKLRWNDRGTLMVPHGYVNALACDPIEKKPFYHAFPGSDALSVGMLGCNLKCSFCQNWITSQTLRDKKAMSSVRCVDAARISELAIENATPVIALTYNEPLITSEWSVEILKTNTDTANRKLFGAYVSNGHACAKVLKYIQPYVQLYKVDLKCFSDEQYHTLGGRLDIVLKTIKMLHAMGFWLEVVTLIVPGFNDDDDEIKQMAQFLVEISPDIPWHLTAFHSDYKMTDTHTTSVQRLASAAEIGATAGLRYVYAGNRPGMVGNWEDTRCPDCLATVIKRSGFSVTENNLRNGHCHECGRAIPGFWSTDCVIPQENMGISAYLKANPHAAG